MSKSAFEKCYDKHYGEWREVYDDDKEIGRQVWLAALDWVLRQVDEYDSDEIRILNKTKQSKIRKEIQKVEDEK